MEPALNQIDNYRWEIPQTGKMRVRGKIFASVKMIPKIMSDKALSQVANVAQLPGIVGAALAMPDIHWGYGFPIGGVAATAFNDEGVISPGGIGYDISCGVRMLSTGLTYEEAAPKLKDCLYALYNHVPSGVGSEGNLRLKPQDMRKVFEKGAAWTIEREGGDKDDLETCEDAGRIPQADPSLISERAIERGKDQLGTLGSGNHFLEVQVVDEIYDEETARVFGLFKGQVTVMIHTGSRGLGYQVCEDFLKTMMAAAQKYRIHLPDPQLACAPLKSREGKDYFAAMGAAANFARANRQAITHQVREAFMEAYQRGPKDLAMKVVYDVCHNIGKIEEHIVDGKKQKLCVHRKGATRAFPKNHPEVPEKYRDVGQPVLIPGTMGTNSYVCVGTEAAMHETFGTTCHGAGRNLSRTQALKQVNGHALLAELEAKNIFVKSGSVRGLAEEAPQAYKDIHDVIDTCHAAGLSLKVARLKPLAVVKG